MKKILSISIPIFFLFVNGYAQTKTIPPPPKSFIVDRDTVDVEVKDVNTFLKKYPDAKLIIDDFSVLVDSIKAQNDTLPPPPPKKIDEFSILEDDKKEKMDLEPVSKLCIWEAKADNYFAIEKYDSAMYYYNKLIEFSNFETKTKETDNCYNYFYKGLCKSSLENYIEAIADFNKAILLLPQEKNKYWWCNRCDEMNGEYTKVKRMSIIHRSYYEVYTERGRAKVELKDYRGAMQDFTKGIECNPNDYWLYLLRANCKYHLDDFSGAKIDLDKCLSYKNNFEEEYYRMSDFAKAFFMRGLCNIYLGNINSGCLDLSKAGELGQKEAYDLIQKHCQ